MLTNLGHIYMVLVKMVRSKELLTMVRTLKIFESLTGREMVIPVI